MTGAHVCPYVRSARDVPDLRAWMVEEWMPGNAFALTAGTHHVDMSTGARKVDPFSHEAVQTLGWNLMLMKEAELWWIDADMVDLLETSSRDLPPCDLQRELVPHAPVFCVFERPLQGLDADNEGHPVLVDGYMWGWAMIEDVPCISATVYSRLDFDEGLNPRQMGRATGLVMEQAHLQSNWERGWKTRIGGREGTAMTLRGQVWVPLGRADWRLGDDWNFQMKGVDDVKHASISEDRRWLATLWALVAQPNIIQLHDGMLPYDYGDRAMRRRAARAGQPEPTVRLVSLRKRIYQAAGLSREPGEHPRTYHVRWTVKQHWRNQAYGPGRAYRRPTLIPAHVKGPEDAPMKKGSVVHVLREES